MILKVAQLGHPVLRQRASPVPLRQIAAPAMERFLATLVQTMREHEGVGIAAPQVHVSLQAAVIGGRGSPRYPRAPRIPLTFLINPKVRPAGSRRVADWEGCLSVPSMRGLVPRWHSVEVEAYNAEGRKVRFRASGFFARVIQHEWDHLQGRVFLDRMPDLTTLAHLTEHQRYWLK